MLGKTRKKRVSASRVERLIPSRELNKATRPYACSKPCAFKEQRKTKKKKNEIIPPAPKNPPRNPQHPGDRDHLATAFHETHPTREPILARFHRPRVGGNRPRTALAIIKTTNVTRTHTETQTDNLNNGTLYAPRYKWAFCLYLKNSIGRFASSALPHCK